MPFELIAEPASAVRMLFPASSTSASAGRVAPVLRRFAPGILLASGVAVAAALAEPVIAALFRSLGSSYRLPTIVIALVIGIALHRVAIRPVFEPGLGWCVKRLLRFAIALLGVRIALSDIVELGVGTALLVIVAMGCTLVAGVYLARFLKVTDGYGTLAGAATAVCGASATLATATVVPNYPQKGADVTFTVVAANAVSTLVMILYPPLCIALGLNTEATGILLGATIHDMAQVVGAGYAVSEPVGNTAVVVKLFRVFLLLPVVLAVGWWFMRASGEAGEAKVPVPGFALAFLALCLVNSAVPLVPALVPIYQPLKAIIGEASTWGLLIAIAALGLGTSLASLFRIGWRHIAVFTGTTIVILTIVTAGLAAMF
jgi:uncharacterized integral membrane protein (TIGR00698 family)